MTFHSTFRPAIFLAFIVSSFSLSAQHHKCGSMSLFHQRAAADPARLNRMQETETRIQQWLQQHPNTDRAESTVTIPVVVHVLWHEAVENISDQQIFSQIDILNEDFQLLNDDSLEESHPFWSVSANADIAFCLAAQDPDGNPTNGITRTYTDVVSFNGDDGNEKVSANGGKDNWDPTQYLNIWVCNLNASGSTLGYATFPSDLASAPQEDGVVIRYQAFGNTGTAEAPNDKGRTATHEVGHWLNLRHIWGDANCGDDFVSDTEPAETDNSGCPEFPYNANNNCGSGPNGEMFMNYMDYVDDACMNMFTAGQADRMNAALNTERAAILNSPGCNKSTRIVESSFSAFSLYPNPSAGVVALQGRQSQLETVRLFDAVGNLVFNQSGIGQMATQLRLENLTNGIYFVEVSDGKITSGQKLVLIR